MAALFLLISIALRSYAIPRKTKLVFHDEVIVSIDDFVCLLNSDGNSNAGYGCDWSLFILAAGSYHTTQVFSTDAVAVLISGNWFLFHL